jgi:ABC-type antimicrobial peptide transport system permease subunit
MSSTIIVIAGIAVGVLAMAGAIAYGTANQQNYVQEDSVLAEAATQGILPKTGMLGADLNREQWHEDPFAEKAAEVRAQWEKTNGQ